MEVIFSMKTKVLALLLVLLMLVPCVLAACGDKEGTNSTSSGATANETTGDSSDASSGATTDTSTETVTKDYDMPEQDESVLDEDWNKVIIGSTTDLSGDFRFPGYGGSSAVASDIDINNLTVGYSTMEVDRYGAYQWNETAVASHTEEEDSDGNFVITVKINEGLKFSDGTEVKAVNYLAYVLAYSSPVVKANKHPAMAGNAFVGFNDFNNYSGEGSPAEVKDEDGNVVAHPCKEFKGIRLLGDYEFSITIAAPTYYPYYYADTYGAISPYPLDLIVGEGVEVKDDGNGAYLTDAWYAKADGSTDDALLWAKADLLKEARYDVSKYAFSGPYVISNWDSSTKEITLKVNKYYAGNWEGQKPPIGTIVYTKVVQETQMDAIKNGQVDIISGLTGGDVVNAAIDLAKTDGFSECHYDRAGYGKIQFDCDFSPAMFTEVRQAVSYLINKEEFASTFTGGYGAVVYGPYAVVMPQYKDVEQDLQIEPYDYSIANAKKVLEDGGWVYNSKGEAYAEGGTGVDSVRYKKLEGDEASEANIAFASVSNDDGITYKTVKVGDDYYMPLVLNWFGTDNNNVTDMLSAILVSGDGPKQIGMVVRSTTGDFDALTGQVYRDPDYGYADPPKYSMYNLATGWNSAIYDYAFNWRLDPAWFDNSVNKLYDEYDVAFPYDEHTGLTYEEAMEQSDGKLGMDYLSMAMVYSVEPGDTENYNKWWKAYIERWNYLEPDIPLYGNVYYDLYNSKIEHLQTSAYFGPASAVLYCTVKKPA